MREGECWVFRCRECGAERRYATTCGITEDDARFLVWYSYWWIDVGQGEAEEWLCLPCRKAAGLWADLPTAPRPKSRRV